MSLINVLDMTTANLIAAGEVVERPANAVKELLENSADAEAKNITVEIKNGGTSLLRITDDGCGMYKDDLEKCILRHATSKIKNAEDLFSVSTMGFRGEALAAISAISLMRILTKRGENAMGNLLCACFGKITAVEEAGCPDGTTIICEDMFSNVPARRKFLKKDFTEAAAVVAVCEKFALSRPDISLTVISDGVRKFQSPGNGNLEETIYAVLGKEIAKKLIAVDYEYFSLHCYGYVLRPEMSKGNRNMQNFFINRRYVRSRTMMAALEEGFHSFCPVGKFPCCILFLDMPFGSVDVNIHPSKLEVKFSDERKVFDTVFFGVRNALSKGLGSYNENNSVSAEIKETPSVFNPQNDVAFTHEKTEDTLPKGNSSDSLISVVPEEKFSSSYILKSPEKGWGNPLSVPDFINQGIHNDFKSTLVSEKEKQAVVSEEISLVETSEEKGNFENNYKYIGEVFDVYILVQSKDQLYLVDKHAAHERILYEKLKNGSKISGAQNLLLPLTINLTSEESDTLRENKKYFYDVGYEYEEFGLNTIILRSCPVGIEEKEAQEIFCDLLDKCHVSNTKAAKDIFDKALYSAACKAAIKAGEKTGSYHNEWIIKQIFENEAVLFCPHGRPVLVSFSHDKLDKMFKRT